MVKFDVREDTKIVRSVLSKFRNRTAAYLATFAAVLIGAIGGGVANASTTYVDPTNGAGDTFIATLKGFFLNNVVTSALGLMAVTLSIGVLVAWGRRAIKSR